MMCSFEYWIWEKFTFQIIPLWIVVPGRSPNKASFLLYSEGVTPEGEEVELSPAQSRNCLFAKIAVTEI